MSGHVICGERASRTDILMGSFALALAMHVMVVVMMPHVSRASRGLRSSST